MQIIPWAHTYETLLSPLSSRQCFVDSLSLSRSLAEAIQPLTT